LFFLAFSSFILFSLLFLFSFSLSSSAFFVFSLSSNSAGVSLLVNSLTRGSSYLWMHQEEKAKQLQRRLKRNKRRPQWHHKEMTKAQDTAS